jgi:hypothetical protein
MLIYLRGTFKGKSEGRTPRRVSIATNKALAGGKGI